MSKSKEKLFTDFPPVTTEQWMERVTADLKGADFELAVKKMNTTPEKCISVGDRYDMDISLPLELGMSGILVYSVNDVYELPKLLMQNNS